MSLISRQAAIDAICKRCDLVQDDNAPCMEKCNDIKILEALPSAPQWIPVLWHEITDEEREENGYPKDWAYHLDCEMPDDDQTIIVQTRSGWIATDVCYIEDGYSLDSGWDWREDIVAWMKMPDPYKGVTE